MDRFELGTLRAYYGALLTPRQNELLRLHYDEDISLGELAEMYSVSRQAVLDAIRRGERTLCEFERKLGLVTKELRVLALVGEAQTALAEGDTEACAKILPEVRAAMEE